jgi:hypothetical protein
MKIAHREAFGGPGLLGNPTAAQGDLAMLVSMIVDPSVGL